MNYFLEVMSKYANFSGRARRSEYWYFVLFYSIFLIVAMLVDNTMGFTIYNLPYGACYILYVLVTLIPSFSVTVRRLHDIDKSGWFLLISLIPIIGGIWLLVLLCTDSDNGLNKYGENPKLNGLISCPNCSKKLKTSEELRFCTNCGTKLNNN